jgi:hypothetical protein
MLERVMKMLAITEVLWNWIVTAAAVVLLVVILGTSAILNRSAARREQKRGRSAIPSPSTEERDEETRKAA